jgi:hypothetical protein
MSCIHFRVTANKIVLKVKNLISVNSFCINEIIDIIMILKTNIYLLTINVFILGMPYLSCDCGPFGYTPYHEFDDDTQNRNVSSESSEVRYYCLDSYGFNARDSFYNEVRNCIKGKWTGRVPKCGKYKAIKLNKNID